MRRRPVIAASFAACVLAAAPWAATAAAPAGPAEAALKAPGGEDLGKAVFTDAPVGVLIRLDLKGLTPGWHGVHLHETGACTDAKFQSAGGHINHAPAKKPHGLLNPDGPDFGDLPNIFVADDGTAHAEMFSTFVSLDGSGGRPALRDEDGSSIVVHAAPDDYTNQPIGNAGDRVACGAISAPAQ
jgi:Cu-Zn family superoxide dismutase